MHAAASDEHARDQENFIRTLLKENVRTTAACDVISTQTERVAFDLVVTWRAQIQYHETTRTGRFGGDGYTHYVESNDDLQVRVDAYATDVLADEHTYDIIHRAVLALENRGFEQTDALYVRKEARNFAWVRNCQKCEGHGHLICGVCGGSGKVTCWTCTGSGRTRCNLCSGSGDIQYTEYVYSGSSSVSVTKTRSCSCLHGTVTCHSCNGSRRQTCRSCSGSGYVQCGTCAGTGALSTLRSMTLIATPSRRLNIAGDASAFARKTLSSYGDPRTIPNSTYTGTWKAQSSRVISNHTVAYTQVATTRFLESSVRVGTQSYAFKTFGQTLHVIDGGRLVEHLLEADRHRLAEAIAPSMRSVAANPFAWFGRLIDATRDALASRLHVHLLNRAYGSHVASELVGSVSETYARDVVIDLQVALRQIHVTASTSVWIIATVIVLTFIGLHVRDAGHVTTVHQLRATILEMPYGNAFGISALSSAIYLISRVLGALPFARRGDETVLESLALVRGSVRIRTLLSVVAMSLLLAVASIVVR